MKIKEELPATNTTSVAGAGDDGIVVVKKKKKKKPLYPGYEEVVAVDRRLKERLINTGGSYIEVTSKNVLRLIQN